MAGERETGGRAQRERETRHTTVKKQESTSAANTSSILCKWETHSQAPEGQIRESKAKEVDDSNSNGQHVVRSQECIKVLSKSTGPSEGEWTDS